MSPGAASACRSPDHALAKHLAALAQAAHGYSAARLAELDRREAFPADACAVLDEFGLPGYYVPQRDGGRLADLSELMQLWRAVARHDLTVAIGHGKTFLGCVCVWVAGNDTQRRNVAREVTAGSVFSWGLTERAHGSDLLAGELVAIPESGGWRLHGEKWLINNATRGQMICVLARTGSAGDPRGFSLFLVDKRNLPPDSFRCSPKARTHGIRGADISGIAFFGAAVAKEALIGKEGEGIEIVLKALQLTRSACVGLSLGAADHALRLATGFMSERRLYGRTLVDLPLAARTLGEGFAMQFAAEVVGLVATRSSRALPGEMSVTSAIAKAFVPGTVEKLIGTMGEMMGARGYLDQIYAHGMFQKLERDHRIVPIFDGSTVVNRNALINQFPMLVRSWQRGLYDEHGLQAALAAAPSHQLLNPEKMRLLSTTGSTVVQSLPGAVDKLVELANRGKTSPAIAALARRFHGCVDEVLGEMAQHQPSARDVPATAFFLAHRYELCYAGAACIHFWLFHHKDQDGTLASQPAWLHASLTWVLGELGAADLDSDLSSYDALCSILLANTASWREHGVSLLAPLTGTADL